MTTRLRSSDVFINCPFDAAYRPIFDAIVFGVYHLGFVARCSLEEDDAGEFRLSKIERIVEECRFGINDLSAVALDAATGLPRFNMPLELDQYRYRTFISDISGQDIRAHGGNPDRLTFLDLSKMITDWLRTSR